MRTHAMHRLHLPLLDNHVGVLYRCFLPAASATRKMLRDACCTCYELWYSALGKISLRRRTLNIAVSGMLCALC